MSSISVNVRFYGARKNVFHFRECSFLRCKKKMSSISVNARMKKAAESLGGIIFFIRCGCKKTSFGGEQCKMHGETFIIKI